MTSRMTHYYEEAKRELARVAPDRARELMTRLDQMTTLAAENNHPVDMAWAMGQWNALNERANAQ